MSGRSAPRNHTALLVIMAVITTATFIGITSTCLAQSAVVDARRFELRIEDGRLIGNVKAVQVKRDEFIELIWSADRRTILHLHGYDIEVTVNPGETQIMAFRARATGRFPIETHEGRHTVLLYIEVHPR
jgi:hypothetical protein